MRHMRVIGVLVLAASSLFARDYKGPGYKLPQVMRVRVESGMNARAAQALEFWSRQTGIRFELVNTGPWDLRLESAIGEQMQQGQEGRAYLPGSKWNGIGEVRRGASAWVMAHEIGHLLGYVHVDSKDSLMCPIEHDGWSVEVSESLAAASRRAAASK